MNTFTLKQITNLCLFRPTLKTGKTGLDLTITVILYMLMQNNVRTRDFIIICESYKLRTVKRAK